MTILYARFDDGIENNVLLDQLVKYELILREVERVEYGMPTYFLISLSITLVLKLNILGIMLRLWACTEMTAILLIIIYVVF